VIFNLLSLQYPLMPLKACSNALLGKNTNYANVIYILTLNSAL